jgi:hypothetical protein
MRPAALIDKDPIQTSSDETAPVVQPTRRPRPVMVEAGPPPEAVTWTSKEDRAEMIKIWRHAVFGRFGTQGRTLRLAWILTDLVVKRGFAYAGDEHLEAETRVHADGVERALTALERAGAILRVHRSEKGKARRRIYLARRIIEDDPETRQVGGRSPANLAGKIQKDTKTRVRARNANAARADAQRRDARARGETVNSWLFEEDA